MSESKPKSTHCIFFTMPDGKKIVGEYMNELDAHVALEAVGKIGVSIFVSPTRRINSAYVVSAELGPLSHMS